MLKKMVKKCLFLKRGISIDLASSMNYGVKVSISQESISYPSKIIDSVVQITDIGEGCFLEHVTCYGDIRLGRFVSISGPGTILHAEVGKIEIGSFSSIAENVSIQEFNHRMDRPTTLAVNHMIFKENAADDWTSKGDVVIGEDVWIGSNAVVLSGVHVGRGGVIAAGSVVTKEIPPYAVVAGNPARIIKYRFDEKRIRELENSRWWTWPVKEILKNKDFFEAHANPHEIIRETFE